MSLDRRLAALEAHHGVLTSTEESQLDAEMERLLDELAAREGITPDEAFARIAAELEAEEAGRARRRV